MISVSKLTKAFGPVLAVDRISFEVAKGQIVGFLGPNGAGKSTTLKMLTCYLPPTSGTATVNGFDIFHESHRVRENLGYLPENTPLYTEMKVEEYLDFRGRLRLMDRKGRRERIDYVVERCWLKTVRGRVIGHLSKGYRQRVGLADALLHDPPVLVLDEPTVGLDPTQILETRKLIRELAGKHTVVLSTHILPEVEAICTRAIIIASGRIVAQGTPDELRAGMRSGARVVVECRGPAHEVEAALRRVSGVGGVDRLGGEQAAAGAAHGYVAFAVSGEGSRDVREEVAGTVIRNGWPLRELRVERGTLEQLFVQVTAKHDGKHDGQPGGKHDARPKAVPS